MLASSAMIVADFMLTVSDGGRCQTVAKMNVRSESESALI